MLSEKTLETYLYKYTKKQDEFYLGVIKCIAERVEANTHIASLDKLFSLAEMLKTTKDLNNIKRLQTDFKKSMVRALKIDLLDIANRVYIELKPLFGEGATPMRYNPKMYGEVIDAIDEALISMDRLISQPVFSINGHKYTPQDTYTRIVQNALQTRPIEGPVISMRNSVSPLFDARLQFMNNLTDNEGNALTSDARAVRMNVLSSIKNVINTVNEEVTKRVATDGIELSAHVFPAPDHEPVQGHQFTLEEFEKMQNGQDCVDIQGRSYQGFQRKIGEWNCRHYTKPIVIGKTPPEYTDNELKSIIERNHTGYTTQDGRHYTMYECTQIQRGYERHIREFKEKYVAAKAMQDKTRMAFYKGKVNTYSKQYRTFSNACGLPINYPRTRVTEY